MSHRGRIPGFPFLLFSHCSPGKWPGDGKQRCVVTVIRRTVMWAILPPSFGMWTAQHPSGTLGCCFGAQKCVFLGKKRTIFLSRGWELSARWGKWVAGVTSFRSFYLRADLVQHCVPRARMSPTPQYLQCGHYGIICWMLNIIRHSTARLKGYLTVYRTSSCDLEVRMLITV